MSAAINTARSASKFATSLIDLLDRIEYRKVSVADQFDPVYRLRYEAYRRENFVPVNSEQLVRDEFDELPNAHTYGVYLDGELVSSLRFHVVTPDFRTSPSYSVFTDVLDPLLDKGATFIDPGRFTADYEASLTYPALPFFTLRIVVMASSHYGVDYCLSAVRPEHAPFYRRVFDSRQLSGERFYHGLTFPMVLYASHVPTTMGPLCQRYPFFMSTEEERYQMFEAAPSATNLIVPTARLAQMLNERRRAMAS